MHLPKTPKDQGRIVDATEHGTPRPGPYSSPAQASAPFSWAQENPTFLAIEIQMKLGTAGRRLMGIERETGAGGFLGWPQALPKVVWKDSGVLLASSLPTLFPVHNWKTTDTEKNWDEDTGYR